MSELNFIHQFINSSIHSFVYSFIHSFIYSFITPSLLEVCDHEVEEGEKLSLVSKSGMDGYGLHRARLQMINVFQSLEENPHLDPDLYKNYF